MQAALVLVVPLVIMVVQQPSPVPELLCLLEVALEDQHLFQWQLEALILELAAVSLLVAIIIFKAVEAVRSSIRLVCLVAGLGAEEALLHGLDRLTTAVMHPMVVIMNIIKHSVVVRV